MDFSNLNDKSGLTADEQIQAEFAGDDTLLLFVMDGEHEPFHKAVFKQGITFEWVKNKIADIIEARYQDLSLFQNGKRIPEPFCLCDMGTKSGTTLVVKLAEGAVVGNEALRLQVLREIEEEEKNNNDE